MTRCIEAICTPIICADLINQNVPYVTSNYPHLKGLKLATNLDKRIDILIGSDYYYSIVSGEILKRKNRGTSRNKFFIRLDFT